METVVCGFHHAIVRNKFFWVVSKKRTFLRNTLSVGSTVYGWLTFSINFQASLSLAKFLSPIFSKSFSVSFNHLLPYEVLFNAFFKVLSTDVLSICLNLPFLISETVFVSLYRFINSWLVLILHAPFSFTGPNILFNIFLSHIAEVYSFETSGVNYPATQRYNPQDLFLNSKTGLQLIRSFSVVSFPVDIVACFSRDRALSCL